MNANDRPRLDVTQAARCCTMLRTTAGVMSYEDWCRREAARMCEAGADAAVRHIGKGPRRMCCVVRFDAPQLRGWSPLVLRVERLFHGR